MCKINLGACNSVAPQHSEHVTLTDINASEQVFIVIPYRTRQCEGAQVPPFEYRGL